MLTFLGPRLSARKLYLFEAGCLRRTAGAEVVAEQIEQLADQRAAVESPTGLAGLMMSALAGMAWLTRGPVQAAVLRDIAGNPYRPIELEPAWRTATAVSIAERIFEERDYAALPVLADALEDAGCEVPELLSHCRSVGAHVRGCWVVDLVLGRS
jgi:hypothetical protein